VPGYPPATRNGRVREQSDASAAHYIDSRHSGGALAPVAAGITAGLAAPIRYSRSYSEETAFTELSAQGSGLGDDRRRDGLPHGSPELRSSSRW